MDPRLFSLSTSEYKLVQPRHCRNQYAAGFNIPVCETTLARAKILDLKQHRYLGDILREPSENRRFLEQYRNSLGQYAENHLSRQEPSGLEKYLQEETQGIDGQYSIYDVLSAHVSGISNVPPAWIEYLSTKDGKSGLQRESLWVRYFNATPYTTFWMIDYLMYKSKVSYAALWDNPKILKKVGKGVESRVPNPITEDLSLLSVTPGSCSSFAVQVGEHLQDLPNFEFEYYDMNGHKMARCRNTGVLIDSASPNGPLDLPDEKLVAAVDDPRRREWSYESSTKTLKHRSNNRLGVVKESRSNIVLSADRSVAMSLQNIADQAHLEPLCLFRSATPNFKIKFYGMIKWALQKKELQLIQDVDDRENPTKLTKFVWDGKNEENMANYSAQYSSILARFIFYEGGPMAYMQWDTCFPVFRNCWISACMKWGFPRVEGVVDWPALPNNMQLKIMDRAKQAVGNVILDGPDVKNRPNFHWLW